jgi:hypothetical protein
MICIIYNFFVIYYRMGFIGGVVGAELGKEGGGMASTAIAKQLGAGKRGQRLAGNIGSKLGAAGGGFLGASLVPFKNGGVVGKGLKRGTPTPILAHAGEVVIPLNAKATKAQMKIIKLNQQRYK